MTTGTRHGGRLAGVPDSVTRAFRDLMELAGPPRADPTSRDAAILRARRAPRRRTPGPGCDVGQRRGAPPGRERLDDRDAAAAGDAYDVLVGLVDGYAGSVRVRHDERTEVADSIGAE